MPSAAFAAVPAQKSTAPTQPRLMVTVSPPTLPADGGTYRSVYVELQSGKNDPLAAPRNVTVTLTSSVLEVGSVDRTVVIAEGETYAVAEFYASLTAGNTNITATASGVAASYATVTTVSPSGSAVKLGVFPSPPALLPQVGSSGKIFVQILDAGGRPARAPSSLNVTLSSSSPNVADVTRGIVIHKGQTYGAAADTVGFTSGSTTITASASGISTGSAPLSVEGQNPSKLYVKVAPDVLAANTGEQALVAVQLQSQDGTPAPAPQDILVHITSSNTTVGVVIGSDITIPGGKSFATTGFLALHQGTSVISATTQSYASGFFGVTVVRPGNTVKGGHLALIPALPIVLPNNGTYMIMVAQLRNSTGSPSFAPSNVIVSLASSNTFVGMTDSLLTIRAGKTFNFAGFYSTLAPGVTNITASASNFISASTLETSAGPIPSRLAVIPGPPILIANGSSYTTTAVQLQDAQGNPAKAPIGITVTLTSSSTEVGSVSGTVTIPAGSAQAYVTFTSRLTPGQTIITATAPGYTAGEALVTTIPPAQSRLSLYSEPQLLPADGSSQPSLAVQLQDERGLPAKADVPINITLVSSNPAAVEVQPTVQIPAGATFAMANITLPNVNGTATITAQAPGLVSASLPLKTVILPLQAVIRVVSPQPVMTLTPVKVQLNLTSGPYAVPNAQLVWSSDSRTTKITDPSPKTNAYGGATATLNFADAGNVSVTVMIKKGGYGERLASAHIPVQLQQLQLSVIPDSTSVGGGGRTNVTATVTSAGRPVGGIAVSWSASSGNIQPAASITDSQGETVVSFSAGAAGVANVTASVSAVGYAPATQSAVISVGGMFGELTLVVPIVVVAAAALGAFFLRRRGMLHLPRRKPAEAAAPQDEGEEEEEE